jgi:hypothetical protein
MPLLGYPTPAKGRSDLQGRLGALLPIEIIRGRKSRPVESFRRPLRLRLCKNERPPPR